MNIRSLYMRISVLSFHLIHHHPLHEDAATSYTVSYPGLGFLNFPRRIILLKKRGNLSRHDSTYVYITGTRTSVKSIELVKPPMIAIAIACRNSEPSPIPAASGVMPKIMVTVVMMIGRNLVGPASRSDSLMP